MESLVGCERSTPVERPESIVEFHVLWILVENYFPQISNVYVDKMSIQAKNNDRKIKNQIKGFVKNSISNKAIYHSKGGIFVYKSYLSFYKDVLLKITLKQFPVLWSFQVALTNSKIDHQSRNLPIPSCTDPFSMLFADVFLSCCPKFILKITNLILQNYDGLNGQNPLRVVYTANGFAGDSTFQIWLAETIKNNGSTYVVGQHGANYGTLQNSKYWPEVRTADYFISWGWTDARVMRQRQSVLIGRKLSNKSCKNIIIIMKGPEIDLFVLQTFYMKEIDLQKNCVFVSALSPPLNNS